MKQFEGKNILEVWDFRLSIGSPILYQDGETWVVKIWANNPGNETRKLLEEHDTGVKTTGNPHDSEAIKACYEWLYSVRDKYSRDNIELRKPITKMINEANAEAVRINGEAAEAHLAGDTRLFNEKTGELQNHLKTANEAVKKASADFRKQVETGGAV